MWRLVLDDISVFVSKNHRSDALWSNVSNNEMLNVQNMESQFHFVPAKTIDDPRRCAAEECLKGRKEGQEMDFIV